VRRQALKRWRSAVFKKTSVPWPPHFNKVPRGFFGFFRFIPVFPLAPKTLQSIALRATSFFTARCGDIRERMLVDIPWFVAGQNARGAFGPAASYEAPGQSSRPGFRRAKSAGFAKFPRE